MAHILIAKISGRKLYVYSEFGSPGKPAKDDTGRLKGRAANYTNFRTIKGWIAEGHTIEVYDKETGDDLTQNVLMQVAAYFGVPLPIALLHKAIREHGQGKINYG